MASVSISCPSCSATDGVVTRDRLHRETLRSFGRYELTTAYTPAGQLQSQHLNSLLSDRDYTWNDNGELIRISSPRQTRSYSYSTTGRLTGVHSARALIARGWGVSLVSRCLRVSRAQLHVILRRTDDWKDGRRSRHSDDTDVLLRIHHVIGELPTYGYRRVWALLRRQAELDGMPAINAKRV